MVGQLLLTLEAILAPYCQDTGAPKRERPGRKRVLIVMFALLQILCPPVRNSASEAFMSSFTDWQKGVSYSSQMRSLEAK